MTNCPICGSPAEVTDVVIESYDVDCPQCKKTVKLNLHPVELVAIFVAFGATLLLGLLGYWLEVRGLMLGAFGAAMLGALAIPLIETVYLRSWPRYVAEEK